MSQIGGAAAEFEAAALRAAASLVADAELDTAAAVVNLVRASNVVIGHLEAEVHRPAGWSWAGFRVLFTLVAVGPQDPSGLARLAGVSRASISSTLNTLERNGFVRRVPAAHDGRRLRVELTAEGEAAAAAGYRRHHEAERRLLARLSAEERVQLASLLRRLLGQSAPAGGDLGDERQDGDADGARGEDDPAPT